MEDIRFNNYEIRDKRTGEVYPLEKFIESLSISRHESEKLEEYYKWKEEKDC